MDIDIDGNCLAQTLAENFGKYSAAGQVIKRYRLQQSSPASN